MSAEPVPQPGGPPPTHLYPSRILLVRHGRSADHLPGELWDEDPPLHDVGHEQARALADRLAAVPLAAIWASNLDRARTTAGYTAERHGMDVSIDPELAEVDLGDWSGGEYRRRAAVLDPAFLVHLESGRWDDVPGSEGDAAFRTRVTGAIDRIIASSLGAFALDQPRPGNVLVVCHSGVVNAYLAELLGVGPSRVSVIENTSITTVAAGAERRRLVLAVNDTAHLGDPLLT